MTLFLTISLLASLTYARVLHVVDIGHEDKEVTTAAKIAVLTCQVSMKMFELHISTKLPFPGSDEPRP